MLVNRKSAREFKPTDYPGIERALFRNNGSGGRSSFLRIVSSQKSTPLVKT